MPKPYRKSLAKHLSGNIKGVGPDNDGGVIFLMAIIRT